MIETDPKEVQETKSQKRLRKKAERDKEMIEKADQETGEISENFIDEDDDEIQLPELPEKAPEKEITLKPEDPTYKFKIPKITMKEVEKRPRRFAEFVILAQLSEIVFQYDILMTVDTEPFDRRIKNEENAKLHFEAQEQQMIDDMKIEEIRKFDERIAGLREDREKLIAMCPDISFSAKVQCVDDSGSFPKFEFEIPKETANKLNDSLECISNYKLQLQFNNQ